MAVSEFLTSLNAVLFVGLTALLVVLYYRQTGIQKAQQELMERNQAPQIEMEDWELEDGYFRFLLPNYGGGAATNLGIDVSLFNHEGEVLYGGKCASTTRKGSGTSLLELPATP